MAKGTYKLSRRSIMRLQGVNMMLVAIVLKAIESSPYDFGIAWMGGWRTAVEQHRLYIDGKSKLDGTFKKSKHQNMTADGRPDGSAFDIVCYKDSEITWDENIFRSVAEHIKKVAKEEYNIDLKWGGDWKKFVDMPHFEL